MELWSLRCVHDVMNTSAAGRPHNVVYRLRSPFCHALATQKYVSPFVFFYANALHKSPLKLLKLADQGHSSQQLQKRQQQQAQQQHETNNYLAYDSA